MSHEELAQNGVWLKQKYQLAVEATCKKCSHKSDIVNGVPSGPHCKALCRKCGAYIKFIGKNDLRLRAAGEDKNPGSRLACTVATVCKPNEAGMLGEVLFVGDGNLKADEERARRLFDKFGYAAKGIRIVIDRIPGVFERDQSLQTVEVA